MLPKVSIVVPCYKVENYLDRCIKSLVDQTLKDIEIILVDDKSPDSTPRLCDKWAEMDSRIRVIHKIQNEGLGMARNSGAEIATGEYITFCDSDDWLDNTAYEKIYQRCKDKALDMCSFQFRRIKANGTIIKCPHVKERRFEGVDGVRDFILGLIGKDYTNPNSETYGMSSCMALFNRELYHNVNAKFPSEREVASEDLIFLLNFAPYMRKIEIVSDVYYNYFINPESISQNYSDEKYNRLIKMLDVVKKYCDNNFSKKIYRNHFFTQQLRIFKVIIKHLSYSNRPLLIKLQHIRNVTTHPYLYDFYNSDVIASYPITDRIYIIAMKYHIDLFFVFLYKIFKR
ncbi:MAG: glycosyltransferase [Ruminococcus sp.]|nr:glycosyltransferase [Ruminococcus sp.]